MHTHSYVLEAEEWYAFLYNAVKEKERREGGRSSVSPLHSTAAFILKLPGKDLDISALNLQHTFRNRGNKQGAVNAIEHLQDSGLGTVHTKQATHGTSLVSNNMYLV